MSYFWLLYTFYGFLTLGVILLILTLIYNALIMNVLLSLSILIIVAPEREGFLEADKYCACFPTLANQIRDIRTDSISFETCIGDTLLLVFNNRFENETTTGLEYNKKFMTIARWIEQKCPKIARESNAAWEIFLYYY